MRSSAAIAVLGLLIALAAGGIAGGDPVDHRAHLGAQLLALDKADVLIAEGITTRRAQLARRVRAFYKLARSQSARLWIDPGERARASRRRALAARILRAEAAELASYEREQEVTGQSRARVGELREAPLAVPAARSLFRPIAGGKVVAPFGEYEGPSSGARLVRHGVELASHAGRNVRAVDAGTVRFVGPLRGRGESVVIAHPSGVVSIVSGLAEIGVATGQSVDRGEVLAEVAGDRVYVEIRAAGGGAGFPVDPEPLFE